MYEARFYVNRKLVSRSEVNRDQDQQFYTPNPGNFSLKSGDKLTVKIGDFKTKPRSINTR